MVQELPGVTLFSLVPGLRKPLPSGYVLAITTLQPPDQRGETFFISLHADARVRHRR